MTFLINFYLIFTFKVYNLKLVIELLSKMHLAVVLEFCALEVKHNLHLVLGVVSNLMMQLERMMDL